MYCTSVHVARINNTNTAGSNTLVGVFTLNLGVFTLGVFTLWFANHSVLGFDLRNTRK